MGIIAFTVVAGCAAFALLNLEVRKHLRSQRRLTKVKRRRWERKIQNERRTNPLRFGTPKSRFY
jgi:hypothetical protein